MSNRNRYERKRQHIREQKKRHAILWGRFNLKLDEEEEKNIFQDDMYSPKYKDPRNNGYQYWETYYLTGPRKYAKYCTNRKIRRFYRDLIANGVSTDNLEDIVAHQGSDYEKEYDYFYTLF